LSYVRVDMVPVAGSLSFTGHQGLFLLR